MKFTEQPFTKSTKAVGLYSITEDYFEQDVNSVFCRNTEFIESGKTLGLLNLEKEITGDIVQGLPRIEEILEARKKNMMVKRIPTSQKRGLLSQKTSLDVNFEFQKVGTSIKENEKINPHKLIKVYFNYYGLLKFFLCDRTKTFKYARLTDNYEASHKSFKKVQLFILNSVQSVYKSQGVTINDKHLEVIIKQMTTKVLITYEGDTPLLQREVIDLYHIQYINDIVSGIQSNIRLFADDTTLYLSVDKNDSQNAAIQMNNDMASIKSWADQWLVNFNPSKTKCMTISNKKVEHPPLYFDNTELKTVTEHKHIGLTFTNNLSWTPHVNDIVHKASKMCDVLRKLQYQIDRLSLETIYFSFIRPTLEYACQVWDDCSDNDKKAIENVQLNEDC